MRLTADWRGWKARRRVRIQLARSSSRRRVTSHAPSELLEITVRVRAEVGSCTLRKETPAPDPSGVGHRHGTAGGPSEHLWMLDTDDVAEASDILSPHVDGPS